MPKLKCNNCPIEWNSTDFAGKLSVNQALFLIAQYTVGYDCEVDDLCQTCRYIEYAQDNLDLKHECHI